MTAPRISKLTFGRNASPMGIGQPRPLLSWRYEQDEHTESNWTQKGYELSFTRQGKETTYKFDSPDNIDVAWPKEEPDLKSRERVEVKVRPSGGEWFSQEVEAALLFSDDWSASMIGIDTNPPALVAMRPFHVLKKWTAEAGPARIYATALGAYEITLNGKRVGDHVLAPGWQSYNHRLHYQTFQVDLVEGENVLEAVVGEGWYCGRLSWWPDCRNVYGSEIGVMIQVETEGKASVVTDDSWRWQYRNLLSSELYDGETYDEGAVPTELRKVKVLSSLKGTLVAPEAPPIRRIQEIKPVELLTSPSGKKILDFGQNMVGWVKIKTLPKQSRMHKSVSLRFAEVLDKGEMGMRPLRTAKQTDRIFLSDQPFNDWEPKFTTHGFRYCEVSGPAEAQVIDNFVGVVVHTDMERIGDFTCSHDMVNKLHQNVIWGLKGNFVGVPTDCPQRDERLGWTGDLQAFAPTANLLYNTAGFLADWFQDLAAEQFKDNEGVVPLVVPNCLSARETHPPQAVWASHQLEIGLTQQGDVAVVTPRDLYQAYGSKTILEQQWESITAWLDKGIARGANGLWLNARNGFQLADWLDPRAPPENAGAALTDQYLVADAYLVGVVDIAAKLADILGNDHDAKRYREEHKRLRKAFQHEYLAPSGRLSSDTQTAYTLAFQFDLLDGDQIKGAAERLLRLVTRGEYKIATGFAGTPGILHALTQAGHLQLAYRMLQEKGCPSWLYPITKGATTIWERWDSLLPDGSINPGEMTSFNHYALGAVANWLHTTVGGLQPLDPGYRRFVVAPRPGGTISRASVYTMTPYGRAEVSWVLKDGVLKVDFEVPPNTTAIVKLGAEEETFGSGKYRKTVKYDAGQWPPDRYENLFTPKAADTLAE